MMNQFYVTRLKKLTSVKKKKKKKKKKKTEEITAVKKNSKSKFRQLFSKAKERKAQN